MDRIERIVKCWNDIGEVEEKDFNWLVEQAKAYQVVRKENKDIERASDIIGEAFSD